MKAKFLIPLVMLLAACNTGNKPMTQTQKDAMQKEATATVKDFFNNFTLNDSSKIYAMTSDSPDMTFVGPGGIANMNDMKKIMKQFFSTVDKQTFDTKSEKYLLLDPTNFIYTWYGKNVVYMKSGEPATYDDFLASYLFTKTGNTWKVLHGHESIKLPEVTDPVKVFTKIEEDWNTAIYNKDVKALDALFATDYKAIDPYGKVTDRKQDLDFVNSGKEKYLAPLGIKDVTARVYGNIAVVNGTVSLKATMEGKDISGNYLFTDVFVYRDGRWQCVNTQGVKIAR